MLRARGVISEANDRGFFCVCVTDCCASYVDEYHAMGLEMISEHDGLRETHRSIRRRVASRGKTDMLRSRSFAAQTFQAPSGRY